QLVGLREIAEAFRKSKRVVRKWINLGAPIVFISDSWQADYHTLWNWLLEQNDQEEKSRA
ncbi:MAG: hypothetical protein LBC94_00040, partial [Desulfovibrio sp.]|nr:hypothetical protein [Desulfovibrio sp.]